MKKILVFGIGGYFRKNEKAIKEEYEVIGYIDNYKNGEFYEGKVIIKPEQIREYEEKYDEIVIMLEKVSLNMEVVRQLLYHQFADADKIKIGLAKYDFQNEFQIAVLEDGRWDIQFSDASIIVTSEMEFWDLRSMYFEDNYCHKLNNGKKDVIIDVGMNIGDSAIYYLNKKDTEKVYGFEPFEQTFKLAKENIERNYFDKSRYEIFPFGLSNHDERKKIFYHPEISIMLSTDDKMSALERRDYENSHCCSLENTLEEAEVEVRKASDIIGEIIKIHQNQNIVLKLDCEGEEYAILEDLDKEKILCMVHYITLEWHYRGKEKIEQYLNRNGFSYCGRIIRQDLGQMFAWK